MLLDLRAAAKGALNKEDAWASYITPLALVVTPPVTIQTDGVRAWVSLQDYPDLFARIATIQRQLVRDISDRIGEVVEGDGSQLLYVKHQHDITQVDGDTRVHTPHLPYGVPVKVLLALHLADVWCGVERDHVWHGGCNWQCQAFTFDHVK